MANHHPIRAIGSRQRKNIERRLRYHAEFMRRFEREGMSREEASAKAFQMIKDGHSPDDDRMSWGAPE